ncbi:prepilin-type N-terminal cleavage/methylation domain-containing protein [Bacillus sp. OK048]|uniref:prepilin-type N-terminal cleavage/methylation domain-containing protein n=1 Tax=Bacillus sp. OK048 TaxID=1882761 RepID=UPI000B873DC4|nr:prepilin-type N-terminal cleavage/methylation domain-containing protein [Bacillus sp. OK048]
MNNNEKGFTLVELLSALAILSMILLIAGSIHMFGQKQMYLQSEVIQDQSNERLALNIITKEIRKAKTAVVIDVIDDVTKTKTKGLEINGTDAYTLKDNNLIKINKAGNHIIISDIKKFDFSQNGTKIKISVENIPETTINLRE